MTMYRRVLLKLSGESLGGPAGKGLDTDSLQATAREVAAAAKAGDVREPRQPSWPEVSGMMLCCKVLSRGVPFRGADK